MLELGKESEVARYKARQVHRFYSLLLKPLTPWTAAMPPAVIIYNADVWTQC